MFVSRSPWATSWRRSSSAGTRRSWAASSTRFGVAADYPFAAALATAPVTLAGFLLLARGAGALEHAYGCLAGIALGFWVAARVAVPLPAAGDHRAVRLQQVDDQPGRSRASRRAGSSLASRHRGQGRRLALGPDRAVLDGVRPRTGHRAGLRLRPVPLPRARAGQLRGRCRSSCPASSPAWRWRRSSCSPGPTCRSDGDRGHTTFCIVLVFNNVLARLRRVSPSLEEASRDLGAAGWQTFLFVSLRPPHGVGGRRAAGVRALLRRDRSPSSPPAPEDDPALDPWRAAERAAAPESTPSPSSWCSAPSCPCTSPSG